MKLSLRTALVAGMLVLPLSQAAAAMPQGDGSQTGDGSTPFTGLAQAPEANLFVGAATTSIPIDVPPGRGNLTPKLALSYSSGGGPSLWGYGWDLPIGKIQRSTKNGVVTNCNDPLINDYVLVLPGGTVECTLSGGTCVPRIEEGFNRIEYKSGNKWEVRDKSGILYIFGGTSSARAGPVNCGSSIAAFNSLSSFRSSAH